MYQRTQTIIVLLVCTIFFSSCSKESHGEQIEVQEEVIENKTPTIELLSPNKDIELNAETTEQLLTWEAKDEDGDALTFDIYFGETLPTTATVLNISDSQYMVTDLKSNTTYTWKIVVKDGTDAVASKEQSFKIKEVVQKGVYLQWQNVNASAYDLYFGESSASQKIISNTDEISHLFQDLVEGKKYYYKVVAKGSSVTFNENFFYYKEEGKRIYDGDIFLDNQEKIKAFGQNGFTEITGTLNIQQNFRQDIRELGWLADLNRVGSIFLSYIDGLTSLYGLHNISSVSGTFSIRNLSDIKQITLDKLIFISGTLNISDNKNIETISMNNLRSISGDLILGGSVVFLLNSTTGYSASVGANLGNPLLSEISFNDLDRLRGNITICKNESLETLNFLSNIDGAYKDLIIWNNDALNDISALSNFTAIAESLVVFDNDLLENLTGLENVTIIAWDTFVSENDRLEHVNLEALTTVGKLNISNNPNIQDLSKLSSLNRMGTGGIYIYGNNQLDNFCGLSNLYRYGEVNGTTYFNENNYNPSVWGITNGYCSQ